MLVTWLFAQFEEHARGLLGTTVGTQAVYDKFYPPHGDITEEDTLAFSSWVTCVLCWNCVTARYWE